MKNIKYMLLALLIGSSAYAADVTLEVNGNDQMKYDVTSLEVTRGDQVTLVFTNVGKLPKNVMGHNLIILKSGINVQEVAMAAMGAKDQDYIPQDKLDSILIHTKLLGPGESDTITFPAPAPGTYRYFCSFPGHFAVMNGTLTVK